jgi:hypothetical protein
VPLVKTYGLHHGEEMDLVLFAGPRT